MRTEKYHSNLARAELHVKNRDNIISVPDRRLGTILRLLEEGLANDWSFGAFEALVMLRDLVKQNAFVPGADD